MIGDQLAPILSVGSRSNVDVEGPHRAHAASQHAASEPRRSVVGVRVPTDTYYCFQYGWEEALDWADPENQDPALDVENEQVTLCVDVLQLDHHQDVSPEAGLCVAL